LTDAADFAVLHPGYTRSEGAATTTIIERLEIEST